MRLPVVLLLILVLAVGALVWAMTAAELPDVAAPGDRGRSAAGETRAGTGAEAAAARAAHALPDEPARPAAPAATVTPAPGDLRVTIRVIDAGDRTAVPRAAVSVMPKRFDWVSMSDADKQVVERFGMDNVGLFAHFGFRTTADEEGRLALGIDRRLFLACEDRGRYGELYLDAAALEPASVHELRLEKDLALHVRVRDDRGAPVVGLGIGLRPTWRDTEIAAAQKGVAHITTTRPTDEEGRVSLVHLQRWATRFAKVAAPDGGSIHLAIPGADGAAFRFDLDALPREVVELTAPALGTVLARVVDPLGRPLGTFEDIRLRAVDAPQSYEGVPAGQGAARFRHVALGQRLELKVQTELEVAPQTLSGPVTPGDEVEVTLRAKTPAVLLTARMVDADHRPAGQMHLRLLYESGEAGGVFMFVCDRDGRFVTEFDEAMVGRRFEVGILQRVTNAEATPETAEIPSTITLKEGLNDLGDLVLRPAPVLGSGRVVVDGAPPTQRPGLNVEVLGEDDWTQLRTAAVLWGEQGAFTVRGSGDAGRRLRLQASARDALPPPPVEFQVGQRDLLVEMHRGGSVRATLLLDHPGLADALRFDLWPDGDDRAAARSLTWRGRSSGGAHEAGADGASPSVSWRGLAPGRYRLTLRALGRRSPLVDIGGLEVPPGGAATDPRLSIDLRGKLKRIRLQLRYASESLASNGALVFAEVGGELVGVYVPRGTATFLLADAADLQVLARGHRIARVPGVDGDRTVELRPIPTVDLRLPQTDRKLEVRFRLHEHPLARRQVRIGRGELPARPFLDAGRSPVKLGAARTVAVPVRIDEVVGVDAWTAAGEPFEVEPLQLRHGGPEVFVVKLE